MRNLALLATAMLAACAAPSFETWYKAGANADDFRVDNGECRARAAAAPGGAGGLIAISTMKTVHEGCLEGKGWQKRP